MKASSITKTDDTKSNRIANLFIHGFLLLGILSLLATVFYLAVNLDIADKIIFKCIPGFVFGLASILIYGFLYTKKH